MNIKHVLSLTSLAVCAAMSTAAMAQSQINFEGQVVTNSCTAQVQGSGTNTVVLNPVELNDLVNNTTSDSTSFQVNLSGCKPETGNYQVSFHQAQAANGRLTNTSTDSYKAKNVSLQILSSVDKALVVHNAVNYNRVPLADDPGITTVAGSGQGTYKVRYYNEGAATSGEIKATAILTMNYQ